MRFCLDYPGINCKQCADNWENDELAPDCDNCPIDKWQTDTIISLNLYDRVTPDGELVLGAVKQALSDLSIPIFKHRMMRRNLTAIHRVVNKHQAEQSKEANEQS